MKKSFITVDQTQRLVILRREKDEDYVISNAKEFIEQPNFEYLFAYLDIVNDPKRTSIHTSSLLAFFAILKSSYKV